MDDNKYISQIIGDKGIKTDISVGINAKSLPILVGAGVLIYILGHYAVKGINMLAKG